MSARQEVANLDERNFLPISRNAFYHVSQTFGFRRERRLHFRRKHSLGVRSARGSFNAENISLTADSEITSLLLHDSASRRVELFLLGKSDHLPTPYRPRDDSDTKEIRILLEADVGKPCFLMKDCHSSESPRRSRVLESLSLAEMKQLGTVSL